MEKNASSSWVEARLVLAEKIESETKLGQLESFDRVERQREDRQKNSRPRFAWVALCLLAVSGLTAFVARKSAPLHEMQDDAPGKKYFPNFELTAHDGSKFRFFDDVIAGKVVLINFIYTRCGSSCPLETARLLKVQTLLQDRIGKDIHFYSISVDPDNDTPQMLRSYRERFKVGEGWTFLTGKKSEVELIQKKLGLYIDEQSLDPLKDHNLNLVVGNQATGQWIRRSHLENPQVLANVLIELHPRQPEISRLPAYSLAPVKITPVSPGEKLFSSHCADCHSIGRGDGLGPDLFRVVEKRPAPWLSRWLKEPDRMLQEQDPTATALFNQFNQIPMPNLQLDDTQVSALIEFLKDESKTVSLQKEIASK